MAKSVMLHERTAKQKKLRLLRTVTLEQDAKSVEISTNSDGVAFTCSKIYIEGTAIFDGNGNLALGAISKNGTNTNVGYNEQVEGGFFGSVVKSGKKFALELNDAFSSESSGKQKLKLVGYTMEQLYGQKVIYISNQAVRFYGGGIIKVNIRTSSMFKTGTTFSFYGIDEE